MYIFATLLLTWVPKRTSNSGTFSALYQRSLEFDLCGRSCRINMMHRAGKGLKLRAPGRGETWGRRTGLRVLCSVAGPRMQTTTREPPRPGGPARETCTAVLPIFIIFEAPTRRKAAEHGLHARLALALIYIPLLTGPQLGGRSETASTRPRIPPLVPAGATAAPSISACISHFVASTSS